ncbi:MAG: DMT family transporter [Patescibacteria group bacterium]|nr:DMT family transporter [Patescibacteria group bacterium]
MLEGLFILLIAQFAGSSIIPVSTKIGIGYFDPIVFVFLRFLVASFLFFPFFFWSKREKLTKKEFARIMLLAFFLFCNVTLFTIGIPHTTVVMSQILYTATPVVVGVLGHVFFSERLTQNKIIGLVVALCGVCFLMFQSASHQEHLTFGSPLGNILVIIAMFGYSAYLLYARTLANSKKYTSVQISFYTFTCIGLYLLLTNIVYLFIVPVSFHAASSVGLLSVLAVGVGNVISYSLLQLGIKMTNSFTASLFQYLGPFLSGLVAIPLLHEKLTPELFIGGSLIIFGVFYATSFDNLKRRLLK